MPSDVIPTQQLPAVVIPGAPPAAPAPAPSQGWDPDEYDRQEALRELAAEEAAASTPAQPTAPTPPAQKPQSGKKGAIMVPKARLDEVLSEVRGLKDRVAYLTGAMERPAAAAAAQPAEPPQPTIEQLMQAQAQIILDASKKFDDGELSMVDFKRVEFRANDVIADLRARHLLHHIETHQPPPRAESVGISDAAALDQHVEQMAAAHPWSTVLRNEELAHLAGIARTEAAALGRPFGTGPAETLRLRQMVAELSDTFGPRWYPNGHPDMQTPAAPARPVQPAAPQAGGRSPAQGQRALELATRQPPNTAGAGYSDTVTEPLTEARVEAMSEDEVMALPAAVRQRLLAA